LTPYNFGPLTERDYTILHGEKVTVLESEPCALRMVRFGLEHGIPLPVNYCSFPFKRRFQHAAARRRAALTVCVPGEVVTEPGCLRALSATGARYCEAVLLQNPSCHHPFEKIVLETGRALYLERRNLTPEVELSDAELAALDAGQPPERVESGLPSIFKGGCWMSRSAPIVGESDGPADAAAREIEKLKREGMALTPNHARAR
jgi:pyruvate formate-lyase activating enzyme-like uncharacterized protein